MVWNREWGEKIFRRIFKLEFFQVVLWTRFCHFVQLEGGRTPSNPPECWHTPFSKYLWERVLPHDEQQSVKLSTSHVFCQDIRKSALPGTTPGPASKGYPKLVLGHLTYGIMPSVFIIWLTSWCRHILYVSVRTKLNVSQKIGDLKIAIQ